MNKRADNKIVAIQKHEDVQLKLDIPDIENVPIIAAMTKNLKVGTSHSSTFIVGTIILCSILFFKKLLIIHSGKRFKPNLNLAVSGSPGSGKSVLDFCLDCFRPLFEYQDLLHSEQLSKYEEKLEAYKNGHLLTKPIKPKSSRLRLSANNSAASFMKRLHDQSGLGLFFENELQMFTSAIRQDWARMMDTMLRLIFHNETITHQRKDDEIIITDPAMTVVFSGTVNQIYELFQNYQSGLFSRFLFICFTEKPHWNNNVFNYSYASAISKDMNELGIKFLDLYKHLDNTPYCYIFRWEEEDQYYLNVKFEELLNFYTKNFGDDTSGIIYRLGLIASRITSILTMLRLYEEGILQKLIPIDDPYLNPNEIAVTATKMERDIAISIVETLLPHGFSILEGFPENAQPTKINPTNARLMLFYRILPDSFYRKDDTVKEVAKKIGVATRTVDLYFNKLVKAGLLEQGILQKAGYYFKTKNKNDNEKK